MLCSGWTGKRATGLQQRQPGSDFTPYRAGYLVGEGPGRGEAYRGMLSVERDGSQGVFSVEDEIFKVPPRPAARSTKQTAKS